MNFLTIKTKNEPLGKPFMTADPLARYIMDPPEDVQKSIRILRQTANKIEHRMIKGSLGAFAAGIYHHNYVNTENWRGSDVIGFDIDHLPNDLFEKTKKRLIEMNGIFMVFRSPSGDGLKVFFHLDKTITSVDCFKHLYTWIWKNIFKEFKFVDTKSFSVSRLCYVSHDPDLYIDVFKPKLNTEQFQKEWDIIALEMFHEMQRKETERIAQREIAKVSGAPIEKRLEGYMKIISKYDINRRGDRRGTNKKIYGFWIGLTKILGDKEAARDELLKIATDYTTKKDVNNLR